MRYRLQCGDRFRIQLQGKRASTLDTHSWCTRFKVTTTFFSRDSTPWAMMEFARDSTYPGTYLLGGIPRRSRFRRFGRCHVDDSFSSWQLLLQCMKCIKVFVAQGSLISRLCLIHGLEAQLHGQSWLVFVLCVFFFPNGVSLVQSPYSSFEYLCERDCLVGCVSVCGDGNALSSLYRQGCGLDVGS